MTKNFKFWTILFFSLFCISTFLLLLNKPNKKSDKYVRSNSELFYPELKRLNSVNKLVGYTDSVYSSLKLQKLDTGVYVNILADILKKRFYHGLAEYSLSENWIAYLCGKIFWSHFSAIVNADDILKHSQSLCSQQNIVFIKILQIKNIDARTVGLGNSEGPGHFVMEVKYDNAWHLYDIDLEPNLEQNNYHKSMAYFLVNKGELYKIYENRLERNLLDKIIKRVSYGVPNKFPAKNMLLFHKFTFFLIYILPIIFLLLFINSFKKIKKVKRYK